MKARKSGSSEKIDRKYVDFWAIVSSSYFLSAFYPSNIFSTRILTSYSVWFVLATHAFLVDSEESKWNYECDENHSSGWACKVNLLEVTDSSDYGKFVNAAKYKNIRAVTVRTEEAIETIPANIFKTFAHLEKVQISIGARNLSNEVFSGANKLLELNLERNSLESVLRKDFSPLSTVQTLSLSFNQISLIEDGAFANMTSLEVLSLDGNKLRSLNSRMLSGLRVLEEIYLKENEIESIEEDAFNFPKLSLIDLDGNKLKTIPPQLFKLASSLKSLVLDNNLLKSLNIDLPSGLFIFSAAFNPISEEFDVISFVSELKSLDSLYLSSTTPKIKFGKANASEPTFGLRRIDVSYNSLTDEEFLTNLRVFPSLEVILIEGNRFKALRGLNETHSTFPNLKTFRIRCNEFECDWLRQQIADLLFKFNTKFDSCFRPEYTTTFVEGVECV